MGNQALQPLRDAQPARFAVAPGGGDDGAVSFTATASGPALQKAVAIVRGIQHPGVPKFMGPLPAPTVGFHTQPIVPLSKALPHVHLSEILYGVFCLGRTLHFLHTEAHVTVGTLAVEGVFVAPARGTMDGGRWAIGDFTDATKWTAEMVSAVASRRSSLPTHSKPDTPRSDGPDAVGVGAPHDVPSPAPHAGEDAENPHPTVPTMSPGIDVPTPQPPADAATGGTTEPNDEQPTETAAEDEARNTPDPTSGEPTTPRPGTPDAAANACEEPATPQPDEEVEAEDEQAPAESPERRALRRRLTTFYREHSPENMSKVEVAMSLDVPEPVIFRKLKEKYAPHLLSTESTSPRPAPRTTPPPATPKPSEATPVTKDHTTAPNVAGVSAGVVSVGTEAHVGDVVQLALFIADVAQRLTPAQVEAQPTSVTTLAGSVVALAARYLQPTAAHEAVAKGSGGQHHGEGGEEARDVFVTSGEQQHPAVEVHVLRWAETVLLGALDARSGAEATVESLLPQLTRKECFLRDPLCACLFDGYELHALSEGDMHGRYELFPQRIQALPPEVAKSRILPWLITPNHFAQTAADVLFKYVFSDEAAGILSSEEKRKFCLTVLSVKDAAVRVAALRFLPQMMPLLPVAFVATDLLADFCHAVFDSDSVLAVGHIKAFRTVLAALLLRCQRGEGGDDLTEDALIKKYNTQILPILFRIATDAHTAPELRGVSLCNMIALWDWHPRAHRSVCFTAVLKCIYDPSPAVRETSLALLHGIVHERNSLFTRSELSQLLIPAVTPLAIDPEPGVRAHAATLSILLYRDSVETTAKEDGRELLPSVNQYTFGSYPQHNKEPLPPRTRVFTTTPMSMVLPQQSI